MSHIMKSPDDLDPFSNEQIALTRLLDAHGCRSVTNLLVSSVGIATAAKMTFNALPLSAWQRAAYEAQSRAENATDSPVSEMEAGAAKLLWMIVVFLQNCDEHGVACLRNQKMRQQTGEVFGDILPEPPEEE